ncbi:MAG: DUF4126 family protein [Rubrobacteraceae bacterium]|nr:DUF4126 family protein [Rubrobacteraceae bacterium]MBA3636976.1 DUF4126 family protein [Rubrobacteraceae bacterium]MDQ3437309.1 DUF4126 family protein [Actinomycetota bacterium]
MSVFRAIGLGAISGLRSMSGPAFVSLAASHGKLNLEGTHLAFLGSSRLSKVLVLMELGELVVDKLPQTPSRTELPSLLGRAASGALVGAAVFVSDGRRATTGAALGSTAAIVAAFAGERLRALAVEKTGLPDLVAALAGDATVLIVGLRSLRHVL